MGKRRMLADAATLEATVAEDPDDDASWSVLHDFLFENDDPRCAVVAAELAKDPKAATKARTALMPLLFGKKHKTVVGRLQQASWRGAYLREVEYFLRSEDETLETEVMDLFLASPASALITRLTFGHGEPTNLMKKTLGRLSDRPLAKALRTLVLAVQNEYRGRADFDLAPLARLPRLEQLSIGAHLRRPKFQRALGDRLVSLAVAPLDAAALRTLFPDAGYPRLRELTLEMTGLPDQPVLSGRATPALEILRVSGSGDRETVVDALSTSALLPQLRELDLEPASQRAVRCAPAKLGPAFAHLERVVVRKGSKWTR